MMEFTIDERPLDMAEKILARSPADLLVVHPN